MILEPRQQVLLQSLRLAGRLSRWELHEATGIRPNTVGTDVAMLLQERIVRECKAEIEGRGRPRIPLEIDPDHRHVIGLAIRPGRVDIARLNLLGDAVGESRTQAVEEPDRLAALAAGLLRDNLGPRTVGLGFAVPGFVDPHAHTILSGSAAGGEHTVSLQSLYDTADKLPVALENDMHALAARWLLTHEPDTEQDRDQDVLLVYLEDGQLGAAMLINGRPNRGCVIGGNELGHTRLPVETDPSYMGHKGTLESVGSTAFLRRQDGRSVSLARRAEQYDGTDLAMSRMLELLGMGIANAVNFMRPNRVVLVSDLLRHRRFADALITQTRSQVLREIDRRTVVELWPQAASDPAHTAGWLALANFYFQGWVQVRPENGRQVDAAATRPARGRSTARA